MPTSLVRYTVGLGMSFWKKGISANWYGHFSESVPCQRAETTATETTATVEMLQSAQAKVPEAEDEQAAQAKVHALRAAQAKVIADEDQAKTTGTVHRAAAGGLFAAVLAIEGLQPALELASAMN